MADRGFKRREVIAGSRTGAERDFETDTARARGSYTEIITRGESFAGDEAFAREKAFTGAPGITGS